MSKADQLRKKMGNQGTVPAFTPRQSVVVQPLTTVEPKPTAEPKASTPKPAAKATAAKPATLKKQSSEKKAQPKKDAELVALFAKVPKEDKRWLDHYRIDESKDLGEVVSEAIQLLKKQVEQG